MAIDHVRRRASGTDTAQHRRTPRAALAGMLSFLVPGAGQLYAGDRRRGLVLLGLTAVIGVAVILLYARGPVFALRLLVQPRVLLALLAAVVLAFGVHAAAIVDAYASAGRASQRPARGLLRVVARLSMLGLLVLAIAVPYGAAAYYDFRSYDLLTSVFADEEPESLDGRSAGVAPVAVVPPPSPAPAPAPQTPSSDLPSVAPSPPALPSEGEQPATAATTADEQPASPQNSAYWKDRGRLNVLLLGGDAGPGRWGLRTDTMIVISISLRDGNTGVFSVPRNLQDVPFPPSAHTDDETFPDILNALWGYAEGNPDLFPGVKRPGPTALEETIGNLLGLRIDYFAAVDLRGFVEMVDALGGVTVNVQQQVYDAGVSPPYEGEDWIVVDLDPGRHKLDGRLALGYVRTRWATSDYDRMQRQRCLVGDLLAQASLPKLLRSFPKLASAMKKYVTTDIPRHALPDLVELLTQLDTKRIVGVNFVPPRFSSFAHVDEMRAAVQAALRHGPSKNKGVDLLEGSCA